MRGAIRILGLDPGLSAMGWGVIAVEGSRLSHIAHGVIATKPSIGLGARLMQLHATLSDVIGTHQPMAISVEQAFVARDPQAALKIGEAIYGGGSSSGSQQQQQQGGENVHEADYESKDEKK